MSPTSDRASLVLPTSAFLFHFSFLGLTPTLNLSLLLEGKQWAPNYEPQMTIHVFLQNVRGFSFSSAKKIPL